MPNKQKIWIMRSVYPYKMTLPISNKYDAYENIVVTMPLTITITTNIQAQTSATNSTLAGTILIYKKHDSRRQPLS